MTSRVPSPIVRLSALIALFCVLPSAWAQDLDSELELKPRARWVLQQGFAPQLLDCRLSEKSDLQCVSSETLRSVRCEATHFGRRTEVQASFKGRAFSCEGTRFDKDSLMSQWKLILKSSNGSESTWIVDGADEDQLTRLYKTEMRSTPLLERAERPFWSMNFANRGSMWQGESLACYGAEFRWGRDRWLVGADLYQVVGLPANYAKDLLRLNSSISLGSGEAGRGWVASFSTGQDFLRSIVRATSHCIGPEYLLNPGSWRFSVGGGNCWIPSSEIPFAPFASAGIKRKLFGPVMLTADSYVRYMTGTFKGVDVSPLETRVQLGVSVAIGPH